MPASELPLVAIGLLLGQMAGSAGPPPGAAGPPAPAPSASPSAFIVAHPDDWQLFMGDVAVARVNSGQPVLFVYLTAGGADRPAGYWLAREAGTAASAYVAARGDPGEVAATRGEDCRPVRVLSHRLHRCHFRNTVSYHLRLPDGGYDGRGFAVTGFQTLAKLMHGHIDRLDAVDASATYRNWEDLARTLASLLAKEATLAGRGPLEIHTHDPDEAGNPGDHSDHLATARLVMEVAARRRAPVTAYSGYDIARRPANLPPAAAAAKMLVFMSYDRQRLLANAQWSAYAEQPASYSSWLFRTYGRAAGPAPP